MNDKLSEHEDEGEDLDDDLDDEFDPDIDDDLDDHDHDDDDHDEEGDINGDLEEDDLDDDDEDDVEADLDAILKERIAAGDDQTEEEEVSAARSAPASAGEAEQVVARGDNEFSCPHCFLLVNSATVIDNECPHCGGPLGVS